MKRLLEVACFNETSVRIAADQGAGRIELCRDYTAGGLTPDVGTIERVRKAVTLPLHVIIRPRGGDFIYSWPELELMKEQVRQCAAIGVNGIVFGFLKEDRTVNIAQCKELIAVAGNMQLTFHRAIDQCSDLKTQIGHLIRLNIHRVLSAGGANNAEEGLPALTILEKTYGSRIAILPGGGIRAANLGKLLSTGCREFHTAGIIGAGEQADAEEIRKMTTLLQGAS